MTSLRIGATTASYTFDGDGKRTSSTVGVNTTSYVYDVSGGLPTLLDDGTHKYVWGLGLAYVTDESGNLQGVYHTDGLGSVRALTDANGSVVQTYGTDEFGITDATLTTGTSSQSMQYSGEQRDSESAFMYLRARMYDPNIGRFMQADPLRKSGVGTAGWNRYTYVGNSPINFTDRSGYCEDPNPGGAGLRFCLDRFIPTMYVPGTALFPFIAGHRISPGGWFSASQTVDVIRSIMCL